MATNNSKKAQTKPVKKVETAQVVGDNIVEENKLRKADGDTVIIACHLPLSHEIDDVPDGANGTKTIVFPGLNSRDGILLGTGYAKAVQIKRADWEAIIAMHGHERMFNSYNGNPPCVMLIKSMDALKGDEVQAMTHGVEPVDPKSVHVTSARDGE